MKLDAKWMGFALAGVALSGCGAILGLDEFKEGSGGSSTGTGTGTGGMASSTSAVTGSGECTGVESRTCYDFGAATLGKGVCKGGMKTCKDGVFGACEGQVGPSTEDCSKPEDENCDGVACSEAIWSEEFGDVSSADKNFAAAEDLVVLANGHILITGVFTSSINFGPTPATSLVCTPGHSNLFLAELGPDGSHIWSERFETQGDAVLDARMAVSSTGQIFLSAFYKEAITLDGKVITATGSDGRDFFIASFDKDGKVLWGDTFGLDSQAGVLDLAVFPDGDPIIVGQYGNGTLALGSTTYPSPVGYNAFVARIGHLDGSVVWSRSYGDNPNDPSGDQSATAVAVDAAGNVVVAGTFNATIDLDGGFQGLAPEGGLDVFVAQVDSKGDPVWHTSFHGATNEVVSSVAVDSSGGVYVAGAFSGTTHFDAIDLTTTKMTTGPADVDFYLVKLTAQGKHAWMKQYGDTAPQLPASPLADDATLVVNVDLKDNVLFAGGFLGTILIGPVALTSAGDSDWFVSKLSPDGSHLWSKTFGDSSPAQFIVGIGADDKTGAVVVAGVNDGSLAIGPGAPLKAKGSLDVVIAKFNP